MQITIDIPPRGPGLPASIPYRNLTSITVTIQRDPAEPNDPVWIDVVNCSPENGAASVVAGAVLDQTGVVLLRGEAQTQPDHSGQLRVRARFLAQEELSGWFSVCAHPIAVQNGPDYCSHVYIEIREEPFAGDDEEPAAPTRHLMAGLYVELLVKSDSGVDEDLDMVLDEEFLSLPLDHSASMQGHPHNAPNPGRQQPATLARIDRHDVGEEQAIGYAATLAGQVGHWSNDQLDKFRCQRCNMPQWRVIPASGYRVTRVISLAKNDRIRLRVTKEPTQCQVDGVEADPGPSPKIEVTLDLEQRIVPAEEGQLEAQALAGIA
ncbi:MAG TPA: hypothetical protein VGP76_11385 [Planctomycetaceae bacterium]|jgi:hypothetical protein|nr:hypothetical protein [Planctomycetaceae bacterium]